MLEVTHEGRAEVEKRRRRSKPEPADDGGTPLHAQASASHDAQGKSAGPLADSLAAHCVAPMPEPYAVINTGQGADHPETSVSRPGSVAVAHMDLNASRFVPAKPFDVSAVPVQRPFDTAPTSAGDAA